MQRASNMPAWQQPTPIANPPNVAISNQYYDGGNASREHHIGDAYYEGQHGSYPSHFTHPDL